MGLTFDEAVAAATAPGQMFEIVETEIGGHPMRTLKNTPASLKQLLDTARLRGDAAFHDGWLRTGDIGRIDDEGFVYVEDRKKDMVAPPVGVAPASVATLPSRSTTEGQGHG